MVPYSLLKKCMMMTWVTENIQNVGNSMKKRKTELTSGGQNLGTVRLRRSIFQGNSLSPLLFVLALAPMPLLLREVKAKYQLVDLQGVNHLLFIDDLELYGQNEKQIDTLVNIVQTLSKDIGMEFRLSKCETLIMKRGVTLRSEGIQLPTDELRRNIGEGRDTNTQLYWNLTDLRTWKLNKKREKNIFVG